MLNFVFYAKNVLLLCLLYEKQAVWNFSVTFLHHFLSAAKYQITWMLSLESMLYIAFQMIWNDNVVMLLA